MKKFGINGQLREIFFFHPLFFTFKSRDECSAPLYIAQSCPTGMDQSTKVLSKRIYDSTLGISKKCIFKVRNKFSPPTSKLVAKFNEAL
jgi:hypothetical protein